jgi:two-component system nitrate/nitrite response regulator NarL
MQILIVDDHLLFAESLRLLLLGTLDADGSVRCANSGAAALEAARQLAPELVLLDWNLGSEPSQEALIEALKTELPEARLVVVSGEAHAEVVRRAIDAGAAGFVPKESTPALLIGALRLIADGGIYLPPQLLRPGDRAERTAPRTERALRSLAEAYPALTPRQQEIVALLVRGLSNKAIARQLDISDGTVKQHLHPVFRALGVANRTEVVYLLAREGVRFS